MVDGMLPPDDGMMGAPPAGGMPPGGMPPGGMPPGGMPPAGMSPDAGGGAPPTPKRDYQQNPLGPEDVEDLERFNISATKLIHSPETRDKILDRIGVSSKGPIDDLAQLSIVLVDRINKQFIEDTGEPVDDAVKIQGSNSVVGQLIEVAEASGKLPKFSEDERAVTLTYAVQLYIDRMIQRGEATKDELMHYAKKAKQMYEESGAAEKEASMGSDAAPMEPEASNAPLAQATQPAETMSQKLGQKGILDDVDT